MDGLVFFRFFAAIYQLSFYEDIDQFRIVQKSENLFKFLIKMNAKINEEVAEKELTAHFCKVLNITASEVKFDIEFIESIPLDKSGKFMIFVWELKNSSVRAKNNIVRIS